MSPEQEKLIAVLSSLQECFASVEGRLKHIETALDPSAPPLSTVRKAALVPRLERPVLQSVVSAPRFTAPTRGDRDRRVTITGDARKSAHLNVYQNRHSEWTRNQQQSVKEPKRKESGIECPKCGSRDTRLSAAKDLSDYLLFFMEYSKVRCRNCQDVFRISKVDAKTEKELKEHPKDFSGRTALNNT